MRAKQDWIMPLVAALLVACVGWWADWELGQVMREELTDVPDPAAAGGEHRLGQLQRGQFILDLSQPGEQAGLFAL